MTRDRQTGLLHGGYAPPDGFEAFPPAVHHASTVIFKNVADMRARDWRSKDAYTTALMQDLEFAEALALLERLGSRWRPETRGELVEVLAGIDRAKDADAS